MWFRRKAHLSWLYQCAGDKDHHLRTQSWSQRTAQFREQRWMYKGAVVSSISSLNNASMATTAHWSHVEWQNLQSLFFYTGICRSLSLEKGVPTESTWSVSAWTITHILRSCYTYLFPAFLLSTLHATAPSEGEEGHQQLWKKKSTTI